MTVYSPLNGLSSQLEEQVDEEDFSALDEPLSECTLAITHGIGKEVAESIIKGSCSIKLEIMLNQLIAYVKNLIQ